MPDSAEYVERERAWAELRQIERNYRFGCGMIVMTGVMVLGSRLAGYAENDVPWPIALLAVALAFGGFAITARESLRWYFWPCPRCGRRFHGLDGQTLAWGPRCRHCRLFEGEALVSDVADPNNSKSVD